MAYKSNEIKRVLREEQSRGRKPPLSEEVIQKKLRERQIVEKLLSERDISLFLKSLSVLGLKKGMDFYELALDAWYDYWHQTRR